MPYRDQTGPEGQGPQTGRGLGYCVEEHYPQSGFFAGRGKGMGLRRRFLSGYGCRFYQEPISEKDEKELLEEDREALKNELASLEKRLKDLKGAK